MHDLTAARRHRIIATCIRLGLPILADKAYQGAGDIIAVPHRRRPGKDLTVRQKSLNRAHSHLRWPVERAIARLKTWRILRKARISPNRLTSIALSVVVVPRQRLAGGSSVAAPLGQLRDLVRPSVRGVRMPMSSLSIDKRTWVQALEQLSVLRVIFSTKGKIHIRLYATRHHGLFAAILTPGPYSVSRRCSTGVRISQTSRYGTGPFS
ncbi:transposase family protein [Streptomyces sp. 900105245]